MSELNNNNNYVQKLQPGDRSENGAYYMGVSDDTGTDFYLFIESAGINKTADYITYNDGTKSLQERFKNGEKFRGLKYSEFQQENKIIASHKDGTADGGVRRLTNREWIKAGEIIKKKSDLSEAVIELCQEHRHIQTASLSGRDCAFFYTPFRGSTLKRRKNDGSYDNNGCVFVGYSMPSLQPGA